MFAAGTSAAETQTVVQSATAVQDKYQYSGLGERKALLLFFFIYIYELSAGAAPFKNSDWAAN